MKERLRGDTKAKAVTIEAARVNGSLVKAVEARVGEPTNNDLPLVKALEDRAPYAVVKIGGKLSTVVIL